MSVMAEINEWMRTGRITAPLNAQSGPRVASHAEFEKMSNADRIDHARRFDQVIEHGRRQDDAAMPAWRDPRLTRQPAS